MNARDQEALRGLRVLIPSNRSVYRALSYGMVIDFEDAVAEVSDADILPLPLPSRRARLEALRHGRRLAPVTPPGDRYDVCLLVAMNPWWIPTLEMIRGLREIADHVVVYLYDSWHAYLHIVRRYRRVWQSVDHVFVSFDHSRDAYAEALGCPVHHLPQAIHEKRFHPYRTERPLDVLSVGRRHPEVHRQLREIAARRDLFYFFQTARNPEAVDLLENQELLGRLCQSSRVQMHWSVESTDPARAEHGGPITARWFEAAATGSVVLGQAPENHEFAELFPYEGFVRRVAPDAPAETERLLLEALEMPDRPARVSLAEFVRTHHTWKARWQRIAETCIA